MAASEMRGDVASSLEHIVRRPIAKSLKHREAVELLSYLSTVLEGDRIQGDSQVRAYTSATKTVLKTLRALSGGDCLAWGLEGDLIALLAATCKYTRRHDSPVEMQSTKDLLKLLLHYLNAKGSLAHDLCKTLKDLCHSLVFRWSQKSSSGEFDVRRQPFVSSSIPQPMRLTKNQQQRWRPSTARANDDSNAVAQQALRLIIFTLHSSRACTEQDVQQFMRSFPALVKCGIAHQAPKASRSLKTPPGKCYVPPHQRMPNKHLSDSEFSDSDVSDAENSRMGMSKVNRTCFLGLQTLECMLSIQTKHFLSYYPMLLSASSDCSILALLAGNSEFKIRLLASKLICHLLDGPSQRAHLAIAERQRNRSPSRGFTTLSVALGNILLNLHTVMRGHIEEEKDSGLLSMMLRALTVVMLGSPYHRLCENQNSAGHLGVRMAFFLWKKFEGLLKKAAGNSSGQDAMENEWNVIGGVLACFSSLASKSDLASFMELRVGCALSEIFAKVIHAVIHFACCAEQIPSSIRLEAAVCLMKIGRLAPSLVVPHVQEVLSSIKGMVDTPSCDGWEDKICQQLIRALSGTFVLFASHDKRDFHSLWCFDGGDLQDFYDFEGRMQPVVVKYCEAIVIDLVKKRDGAALAGLQSFNAELLKRMDAEELVNSVVDIIRNEDGRESIAVRTSACRGLGALLASWQGTPFGLRHGIDALLRAGEDAEDSPTLSAAVSAALSDVPLDNLDQDELNRLSCLGNRFAASRRDKIVWSAVRMLGRLWAISEQVKSIEGTLSKSCETMLLAVEASSSAKVHWNAAVALGFYPKNGEFATRVRDKLVELAGHANSKISRLANDSLSSHA